MILSFLRFLFLMIVAAILILFVSDVAYRIGERAGHIERAFSPSLE